MRTLRTVAELRAALAPTRRADQRIGLVPTMGALHEGHLALIRRAREQCDLVVVSLFVNPAQFNESADLERYPRRERDDAGLAAEAGADLLFAPAVGEVYPPGFATAVEVLGLTDRLEGASRGASHFRGVTTVVTKLLCMTSPDTLYLGEKDAQQVIVIRRLVTDLNLPVAIEVVATAREADGLARSSRNVLLSPPARAQARALHAALSAAEQLATSGERAPERLLSAARDVLDSFDVRPDYLELVDPATLEPIAELDRPGLLAIAAVVGGVRLIDNATLRPAPSAKSGRRQINQRPDAWNGASENAETANAGKGLVRTTCSA
ncbi:MAG TPA: pantoate--beta-alanine ligase [Solirubrobacteraceae bacterium]|jgi:pantoate--beta-alanine ligase